MQRDPARPTRSHWRDVLFALVLTSLFGVIVWAQWQHHPPRPASSDGPKAESAAVQPSTISGRVLLEAESEAEPEAKAEARGETDGDGETQASSEGPPEVSANPVVPLIEPATGSCAARAWRGNELLARAECRADGSFTIEHMFEQGSVDVEVEVPGRLRGVLTTTITPGTHATLPTLALGVGQTLAGQVVDLDGDAVAGVELAAMPTPNLGEPQPWRATTDSAGNFVFETLPPGPIGMRATKPGFASAITQAIAPEHEVVLVLERLVELEGRVVAPNEVIARAKVRLEGSGVWPAIERKLDADGKFSFVDVPDGIYGLEAIASGDAGQHYASIPLENVTPDMQVTLAMTRAFLVPVRVVDPNGRPVARARVTLGYASIGLLQRVAETDAEGRVRIGPVVPGPYVVQADADGFSSAPSRAVDVPVDGLLPEQTLMLIRPGAIQGVVVDERGRAVAGASVALRGEPLISASSHAVRASTFAATRDRGGPLGVTTGVVPAIPNFEFVDDVTPRALSDAAGAFAFELLLPGQYRLEATHGRFVASAEVEVRLVAGERRSHVRLVLRGGERVTGRVLDGNARPFAHASVEFDDGTSVYTDARGVFDAGPRRGRQRITVRASGMIPIHREFEVGSAALDLEFVLEPALGALRGRVVDGNGQPIAGARVDVTIMADPTQIATERTDARGLFTFDALVPGAARIEVQAPDRIRATRKIHIPLRGSATFVEVPVSDAGTLTGRVTDYRSDAVPHAEVIVRDRNGNELARVRADKRGGWRAEGIATGNVIVTAEPPHEREAELAPDTLHSDVLHGRTTVDVDLRLDRR